MDETPETADESIEDRIARLERMVERLTIFVKACWAGASLLADENAVEV